MSAHEQTTRACADTKATFSMRWSAAEFLQFAGCLLAGPSWARVLSIQVTSAMSRAKSVICVVTDRAWLLVQAVPPPPRLGAEPRRGYPRPNHRRAEAPVQRGAGRGFGAVGPRVLRCVVEGVGWFGAVGASGGAGPFQFVVADVDDVPAGLVFDAVVASA